MMEAGMMHAGGRERRHGPDPRWVMPVTGAANRDHPDGKSN